MNSLSPVTNLPVLQDLYTITPSGLAGLYATSRLTYR